MSGASAKPNASTNTYEKVQGPYTEEALYLAVTRSWCRLPSRQVRRERTLREYIFGWHFVTSVERVPVDVKAIIGVILQIVTRSSSPHDGALSLPVRTEKQGPLGDAVAAWWHLIPGQDELGVHYVELIDGVLGLLTVGSLDHQPDPGDSR